MCPGGEHCPPYAHKAGSRKGCAFKSEINAVFMISTGQKHDRDIVDCQRPSKGTSIITSFEDHNLAIHDSVWFKKTYHKMFEYHRVLSLLRNPDTPKDQVQPATQSTLHCENTSSSQFITPEPDPLLPLSRQQDA